MENWLNRDLAISHKVSRWSKNRWRYGIAWVVARTGDSILWVGISAVLIWLRNPLGWQLLITIAVAALLTAVAKGIFKRQRPSEKWAIATDKYSFPSGHSTRAGAVAITLSYAFPQWTILWLTWAILVGFSRVALARHYLSDVFSGLIFGVAISLLIQQIL